MVAEEIKEEVKDTEKKSDTKVKKEKKDTKYLALQEENAKLKRELEELKEQTLKEIAEMQTTKRRLKEESVNERKYASMKVIGELINPIDMLVQVVNCPAPSEEIKQYQMGFSMIANQLLGVLEQEGLTQIKCEAEMEFDPKLMQALTTEEQEGLTTSKVLRVMQKGYMYKDRILKPALVHVGIPVKEEVKNEESTIEVEDSNKENINE